jgi:hypothetical protein
MELFALGSAALFAMAPAPAAPANAQASVQVPPSPSQATPPSEGGPQDAAVPPGLPSNEQPDVTPAAQVAPSATYPEAAAGYGAKAGPAFYLARWAEDWSSMRDPAKRTGPFDALKFIPLDGDGDVYLTLSDEQRLRHDTITSPGLRAGKDTNALLLRNFVGADLHVGENFRAFGQLASGVVLGSNPGNTSPVQRNDLFVQQLFAEVRGEVAPGIQAGIRAGRQDFQDGPIQLVSIQENPNIHITFDGVRAYASSAKARAGVFDLHYVTGGPDAFDDPTDHSRRFSGVTGGFVLPTDLFGGSKLYLDPFFYRYRNRNQRWGNLLDREERRFYGVRLYGDVGRMNIDINGNYQEGEQGGRDISAYQIFAAQTFALGEGTSAPRLGWRADYASGGGAYGNGTLRSANILFGTAPYFSYGLFLGPSNFFDIAPTFTFSVGKKTRVLAEAAAIWRPSETDAIYNGVGAALAGTQNVRGNSVAQLLRLNAVHSLTPNLSFTLRTEYLKAAKALKRADYADALFLGIWGTFRF